MSTDERDPFARWDAGVTQIIARELAGQDVPAAWRIVAEALYQECVRREIRARGGDEQDHWREAEGN